MYGWQNYLEAILQCIRNHGVEKVEKTTIAADKPEHRKEVLEDENMAAHFGTKMTVSDLGKFFKSDIPIPNRAITCLYRFGARFCREYCLIE